MHNIKKFQTTADYESFKNSTDWLEPNLCSIEETREVKYQNITPPALGDVAYYDGTPVIKYISIDKWNTSLGNPIGVVVIPGKMLPDQRARIISLFTADENGNKSNSHPSTTYMGASGLPFYDVVPTTDNLTSEAKSFNRSGYLPEDITAGIYSVVDPYALYPSNETRHFIPSPYKGNNYTFNKEYSKVIVDHKNALSDFNGLSNTEFIKNSYVGKMGWNYKDGYSNKQWYIPAAGELGFLIPRFNKINNIIEQLGGVKFTYVSSRIWSSTEYDKDSVYALGGIDSISKHISDTPRSYQAIVRPFALL